MDESPVQSQWQRAVNRFLSNFQGDDIDLRRMFALWATAMIAVVAVCAAFFMAAYWLIG